VRLLSPFYIWLVCLISFFMLVASNGMVGIYEHVLDNNVDLSYSEKKVANGLGTVGILIIVLRMLEKEYYRSKLLAPKTFACVQTLYYPAGKQSASPGGRPGLVRALSLKTTYDEVFRTLLPG
jgi:hypothetical protein